MPKTPKALSQITSLIHHPYKPPEGFGAVQPAIHKASTVIFPNVESMHHRNWRLGNNYSYGLHGTPTTFTLQERIATLEGGLHCLLAPSGLAAIGLINLALLNQGDEVLIPQNVYGPNWDMLKLVLGRFGVTLRIYDPLQPNQLVELIQPNTRLLWLEAAGSVTMEFPDLSAFIKIARERNIVTVLDNTWGAGVAFNAFDLPDGQSVDLTMHALTKYPSGGADVLMGSIVTRDEALYQRLKATQQLMGINVAANDAELVLRSLPTLAIRYTTQDQSARTLVSWLVSRPEIAQVLHPALPHTQGHAAWLAVCHVEDVIDSDKIDMVEMDPVKSDRVEIKGKAAGLFSVIFQPEYTAEQVNAFCEQLSLFKLGYSWGGPVSLVMPYRLVGLRSSESGGVPVHLVNGALVRFSIGLEDVGDLQADLLQAFGVLG